MLRSVFVYDARFADALPLIPDSETNNESLCMNEIIVATYFNKGDANLWKLNQKLIPDLHSSLVKYQKLHF